MNNWANETLFINSFLIFRNILLEFIKEFNRYSISLEMKIFVL